MTELLRTNKLFYLLAVVFWLCGILIVVLAPKGAPLLWINTYHHSFFDYLFAAFTYLGDGLFSVLFLLSIFCFVNMRKGLVMTLVFLSVVVVVQFLKNIVFDGEPRPSVFFEGVQGIYYIPWLEIHKYNSFPSGHTAQAFCFALCLSLYDKENRFSVELFILAALTGFSRMYLMQHFPIDVLTGSVVGIVVSTVVFYFLEREHSPFQNPRLDQSLFSFIRRPA